MKKLTPNEQIISNDILRYKKNKLASTFAILGIVFNCLFFMLLYAMPAEGMRIPAIGFSVVLTLIVLLTIFLSSEGVKGYNKTYSIVLLVVAVIQIARIFYYPLQGYQKGWFESTQQYTVGYFGAYPDDPATMVFILMLIYLVASAACLIFSAVWGYIVAQRLEGFQKRIDKNEIDIVKTIKELDEEDEAKAKAAQSSATVKPVEESAKPVETASATESVKPVEVAPAEAKPAATEESAKSEATAEEKSAPAKTTAAKTTTAKTATASAAKPASTSAKTTTAKTGTATKTTAAKSTTAGTKSTAAKSTTAGTKSTAAKSTTAGTKSTTAKSSAAGTKSTASSTAKKESGAAKSDAPASSKEVK